ANAWHWFCRALLRLHQGDSAGHRQVCRQMVERFGQVKFEWVWDNLHVALSCLLAPDGLPELTPARYAERALAVEPHNPSFFLIMGAARHRAGQPREAIRLLHQALGERWHDEEGRTSGTALTWLFLSLAHQRLGEVAEARQRLKEADASVARATAGAGQRDLG